jgi:glycine/D-amino acid oxidase-like deaminating enzyme
VIGAGVIGASVAWHLARRGVREVLIVERGQTVGEGSTARATGGFRAQFGSNVPRGSDVCRLPNEYKDDIHGPSQAKKSPSTGRPIA